jgi:hypothetical protein
MEVAVGSKTGKRTGYQYRDNGRKMTRTDNGIRYIRGGIADLHYTDI